MELAGVVVNAIAALGAVAAAAVALIIATRDRQERRAERGAADRAQANLVLVEIPERQGYPHLHVRVHNYGRRPILTAVCEAVVIKGNPSARWEPDPGSEMVLRVVRPQNESEAGGSFCGDFVNTDGTKVATATYDAFGEATYLGQPEVTQIYASVRFTDAGGNVWITDTDGQLSTA